MPVKIYKRQINKKPGDKQQTQYSDKQKFEVVAAYMVMGNMAAVAQATGIPHDTIRHWKQTPWWKDLEEQIRKQARVEVSGKLKRVIDKAFIVVEDRLENGEWVYNSKTGDIVRVGVSAKTAGDILHKSIDRQVVLDKIQEAPETREEAVLDRLASIEKRLIEAAKIRPQPNIIDVEAESTEVENG